MRRIKRLPEGVHSSVRSGVVICDLARVVEELVFNSLEAGATKVSVAVGVGSCYVKVADNGLGITRDELMLLGERYATSKVDHTSVKDPDTECLDFHGEALCSISHISLLEIVTKARGKPNGYKKIMKNCKCLFLGINDDVQDVGTTVIARDIFHNQPVRRKHMESSPKKVLDSIRMSVLRIALVHLNVSFKVVDVEGTGELLHTGPSPSPLPILFSNFGIENSGDFCELNVTDGFMKLSGYITGPRDIFSPKAIQYVYINSRFICKGPIHKLVNELATKFDLSNSLKPTTCSQSEKQNRCHMCPTFILNLNCPRSYYDIVTSERSRTSVEFQDWDLVLTFIENCVKRLWIENISHDTPATCESGRKRCQKQNSQADLNLSSPQLKKPSKNYDNVPDWEECLSPMGKRSKISKLKKHQSEAGFLSETSSHLSPCRVFSPEHHQIVAYTSSKQEDGISSAALVDKLPKFDVNASTRSGVSADYLEFSDDIDKDLKKSFLRSCSFRRSLHDRTPSDERLGFGSDGFRLTKEWANFDDSIVDEVKQVFCGREKHIDVSPPFQLSPITQFDKRERSKFPLVVIRNNMSDSYEQVQKLSSSQQCFPPVWSPISEEKIATIQEYDVIYENLIENHPEFGEDTIYKYSSWREHEDRIESNLNTRGSWQQQNDSFLNFSPYPKVCTYPKREIGEFRWGDFESSLSPSPSKRPRVIDWSLLPCYGEESPKIYSMPSLYGTTSMEPGCGRLYRRNQETMYIRKKRSIRSNSAPPFHKGKKRYLNLSDSSVLSEKSNTQTISRTLFSKEPSNSNHAQHYAKTRNLKNLPKSSGQNQPSPKGKSVADCSFSESPSFGRSQKEDQFNNTKSMECSELNDIKGSFDSGGKWPSHWRTCTMY
ncbi:hypothetical protein ACJIZ3_016874 [Penstemon smallii]|uniref:DNA mismatch repair protein S5 domain-containing protein n=1 Tax=Penstemon smallii TaxID=265156 RepID=A0ABD3SU50_9LAMI